MNRRTFLAAGAAAAGTGTSRAAQKLATEGGTPVRATPLTARYFGPLFYDDKERAELNEVLETGRPFRWYGPGGPPPKVLAFEKAFADGADLDSLRDLTNLLLTSRNLDLKAQQIGLEDRRVKIPLRPLPPPRQRRRGRPEADQRGPE